MSEAQRSVIYGASEEEKAFYESMVATHGSPLLLFDPAQLQRQYEALKKALPNVDLYYAIKALPQIDVLKILDELGAGFDVASSGELDILLGLKVGGRRTIHTHPVKSDKDIRDALRFGATTFVIDNLDELKKLQAYKGRVGILLRVSFRSKNAKVDLSKKFGCSDDEVPGILQQAEHMGLHIKGLSFHVGSQCENAHQHVTAIKRCHEMMVELNQTLKAPLSILDIGGGFPADYSLSSFDIENFCEPIRKVLAELPNDWHIYAEPGRYLIASAVRCVTTIIGKSMRFSKPWYYIDDGVYGSFSGKIFDHAEYPLQTLHSGDSVSSVLAGPTCDSIDIIDENILLPDLNINDLIIGHQMGAYTAATRTRFNLLKEAKFVVL